MCTNFSSLAGITCNFSRFMVSNSDTYQALLDFVNRIYSNRSRIPNSSRMYAQSLLVGVATITSHARLFFSTFVVEVRQKMRFFGSVAAYFMIISQLLEVQFFINQSFVLLLLLMSP